MHDNIGRAVVDDDSGFGLIEIVVSIFIIGIIAVSFLPVLVNTLVMSARNVTVATAGQLITDELDTARRMVTTCTELNTFIAETVPPFTDSRGIQLTAVRSAGSCSDRVPGVVALTISVVRSDDNSRVSTASTLLNVGHN